MKRNRCNRMIPRLFGLVLLFCIGILVISVGTTFARYRDEERKDIPFQVRAPEQILLGTIEEDAFQVSDSLEWIREEDGVSLEFAVANGESIDSYSTFAVANSESTDNYSTRDQAIRLSIFGSAGIAKDGVPPELSVTFISPNGSEEEITVEATASPIIEGTALYHSYGPGWLYRFYETTTEGERELTWKLAGGAFHYITLTIECRGEFTEDSILQPLISAETLNE